MLGRYLLCQAAAFALAAPAAAAAASPAVWRDGEHWVLRAEAADRWAVATALAAASGSRLLEQPQALAAARPLTRHWRGRDLVEAWRQVLGDEVSHALQCDGRRCRVWVLAPTATGLRAPGAAARATVAQAPALEPAAQVPSPVDHGLQEPDPPGLFPSD